jgi:CMP-N-acetylneuraminic acid synthetase
MCVNPCLPFVSIDTYRRAINFFQKDENIKTLTSIKESGNIFFDANFKIINGIPEAIRTTGENKVYEMAHVFHIFDKKYFMDNGKFWDYTKNNPAFFSVDKKECIDVDDPLDFVIASALYEKFGTKLEINL